MPAKRTNSKKGAKDIRIKTARAEKKGFTVVLTASAMGRSYLFFKERGGELGKRVKRALNIPDNVRIRATKNGYQTREEYHHWLRYVFGKQDHRCLLIVDEYRPHRSDEPLWKYSQDPIRIL